MKKRPLSVIIIGCVYIAVGAIGFIAHFHGLGSADATRYDGLWIELVELAAIVCGAFLLRGHNWARWGALAWMGGHVILSVFHSWSEVAIHALLFAVIAWFLLRSRASEYFVTPKTAAP